MTMPYDESLTEDLAIEEALDAARNPHADDPDPTGWLEERAEEDHREEVHVGGPCTCPPPEFGSAFCADARRSFPLSTESPF